MDKFKTPIFREIAYKKSLKAAILCMHNKLYLCKVKSIRLNTHEKPRQVYHHLPFLPSLNPCFQVFAKSCSIPTFAL